MEAIDNTCSCFRIHRALGWLWWRRIFVYEQPSPKPHCPFPWLGGRRSASVYSDRDWYRFHFELSCELQRQPQDDDLRQFDTAYGHGNARGYDWRSFPIRNGDQPFAGRGSIEHPQFLNPSSCID